ncbi:hypothetical protein ACHAAC_08310 [Aeromicrobium sp. CF4.19]|uniref:hypothetical protein n=1 Tax=Aeromicrobium sp. CF4.19 TaxID=3373082 RepID=UPI003EE4D9F5
MRLLARAWPEPTGIAQRWAPRTSQATSALSLVGLVGSLVSDLAGQDWWFDLGLSLYAGLGLVGGLTCALGWDPMRHVGRYDGSDRRVALAMFGPLGATVAVHLVVALVVSVLVMVAQVVVGDSVDGTIVPTALFVVGLLMSLAWLLGTLVGMLVAWPVIHLVRRVLPSRWERDDEDDLVTAGSLFLLFTVAFAVAGVIATSGYDVGPGTAAGQGLERTLLLLTDTGEEPWRLAATWAARGLLVLLVVAGVHWARAARRHRAG